MAIFSFFSLLSAKKCLPSNKLCKVDEKREKNAKVTIFIKGKMLSGFKNHQFAGTTREWNFTKI